MKILFNENQVWNAGENVLFFRAEDGIRDWSVTGVQTCALPISGDREGAQTLRLSFVGLAGSIALLGLWMRAAGGQVSVQLGGLAFWMLVMLALTRLVCARSEERRVGKEVGCRGSPDP